MMTYLIYGTSATLSLISDSSHCVADPLASRAFDFGASVEIYVLGTIGAKLALTQPLTLTHHCLHIVVKTWIFRPQGVLFRVD
jgi:hypothetical protein